jgi:hypothetical protein
VGDDGAAFPTHPTINGASTFGGANCSGVEGRDRDFVRDAIFMLYHARPDYVSRVMHGWVSWVGLPGTTNHYCTSTEGTTPQEMPPMDQFAKWAFRKWCSLRIGNGMMLLLHFIRFTGWGRKEHLDTVDYEYWASLENYLRLSEN